MSTLPSSPIACHSEDSEEDSKCRLHLLPDFHELPALCLPAQQPAWQKVVKTISNVFNLYQTFKSSQHFSFQPNNLPGWIKWRQYQMSSPSTRPLWAPSTLPSSPAACLAEDSEDDMKCPHPLPDLHELPAPCLPAQQPAWLEIVKTISNVVFKHMHTTSKSLLL